MATNSTATKKAKSKPRGRTKKKVPKGKIFIQSTYNNTIISVTDLAGNVLVQSSAGKVGFGGTRKATPYAAQRAVAEVLDRLQPFGMHEAAVYVKGIGSARESAVRALNSPGLAITSIRDVTPIPHNGVRARKKRRV